MLILMTLLSALACAQAPAPFSLTQRPLDSCPGGTLTIARFSFDRADYRSAYRFVVFNDGFKALQAAAADLRGRGYEPVALVNGGYFEENAGAKIVSYFKSSAFENALPRNSKRSPRACLAYDPSQGRFELRQSTDENYAFFKETPGLEVYCAGPQLVEDGRDVARRQACAEQFLPACRDDGSDPGVNLLTSYPRTGACVNAEGALLFFAASSERQKCGISAPDMARAMIAEGCIAGLNHDGGGSTKLYLSDGAAERLILGHGDDRGRAIPTWAAVVRSAPSR